MFTRYRRALPKKWHGLATVFTALGDEHRQRILLMFRRGEELSIKQIVDACPLSRTAAVHHIGVLRDAGVLRAEKRGKAVYLRPDPATVSAALNGLRDYIREEFE
ncbi:MAG: metalloregulator ArsR/SmtB family transcription factor [Burkholderiales bacterium]|nr:metalloregulator ArsR/SmtB family transcription factor [Burkholderiales bacterium]